MGVEVFKPKNEVAEWKMLLPLFQGKSPGTMVTYEQMSEVLGRDLREDRAPIYRLMTYLETDEHRTLENVRGEGYRVPEAYDHERLGKAKHKSAYRTVKRAKRKFSSADHSQLTSEQSVRMDMMTNILANQEVMLRDLDAKVAKQAEQISGVKVDQETLKAEMAALRAKFDAFFTSDAS